MDSFQGQTYRNSFEILVCDNAVDSEIEKLIFEYNRTAKFPVKYFGQDGGIQEVRSKLAFESEGELVLMIDDDEAACPELLELYNRLFTEDDEIVAAGGPCRIVWEDPPPAWIEEFIKTRKETTLWGRYEPHDELKVGVGINIWGGNMVFKRKIFEDTGFRPDVFKGRNMGDGESGLIADLTNRNLKTAHVPEAYVLHFMDKTRFSLKYVRHTASYAGIPFAYRRWHKADKSWYHFVGEIFKIGKLYHRSWIRYAYYRLMKKGITSRQIATEFHAHVGFYQIKYIFWLVGNPFLRAVCDRDDFRPESCLKFFHDWFHK